MELLPDLSRASDEVEVATPLDQVSALTYLQMVEDRLRPKARGCEQQWPACHLKHQNYL